MLHYFECEPLIQVLRSLKCESLILQGDKRLSPCFVIFREADMDFYRIDEAYNKYLQEYEKEKRGVHLFLKNKKQIY